MKIEIAKKIAPFSKEPGVFTIIPKTAYGIRIFPAKLEFYNLKNSQKCLDLFFDFLEVKNYQVFLNADKALIEVLVFFKAGFLRFQIFSEEGLKIFFDKVPGALSFNIDHESAKSTKHNIGQKETIVLPLKTSEESVSSERLSLGEHKAQDMEMVSRRGDLKEILPLWFAIGQIVSKVKFKYDGVAALLLEAEDQIRKREVLKLEETFLNIFKAGFKGIFYPTLIDENFQGIIKQGKVSEDASSLILLEKGYELIRFLFFQREKNDLYILPCLLPSFHSGRIIGLRTSSINIDMEWSKKILKKLIIHSEEKIKINLKLQREIKTFRLRKKKNEKGIFYKQTDALEIEPNVNYFLDSFYK